MKTPEDEAFDDIDRRQGGGFPAKRQMAADKLHWSDCAVHNGPAYPAGKCDCDARLSKYAETLLEEATRSCNNIDEQRALDALMLNFHKPAQEPVGYVYSEAGVKHGAIERDLPNGTPLYVASPQRPWVGLTTDEMKAVADRYHLKPPNIPAAFRAIEAKLKERNHGT
jgi:hypothetical protein